MEHKGLFGFIDELDAVFNSIERFTGISFRGDKSGREKQKQAADSVRNLVSPLIEEGIEIDGRTTYYPHLNEMLHHRNRFIRERIQRVFFAEALALLFSEATDEENEQRERHEEEHDPRIL